MPEPVSTREDAGSVAVTEVAATYPDMSVAHRAVMALESVGVEARKISVVGEGVADARQAERRRATNGRDRRLMAQVLWKGVLWSVVAIPPGAAFGAALQLIGLSPIGMTLNVILWAFFWHIMGAIWGIYAALGAGEAWEMTFQSGKGGAVTVVVRSSEQRDIVRAERVLLGSPSQSDGARA